jgi:hypothetical protein
MQNKMSNNVPSRKLEDLMFYFSQKVLGTSAKKNKTAVQSDAAGKCKLEKSTQVAVGNSAVAIKESADAAPLKRLNATPLRRWIPNQVKKKVFSLANHQCQFHSKETGIRCNSKAYLEIDHIQPLSLGGSDEIQNLRVYCRSHNQLASLRSGLRCPGTVFKWIS